ncbi:hypothetical protein B0T21DRAFT_347955 [Apiosordaria backusii]|uniref:Uncharacterized protein n=1 Tax=Apiosordaria backusii TaxID=314023 RepID=A0AA40EDM6_9PEZI|nr:hypothetical protein B0T21DRAFT_347955 [Apiosordaria backusii]
MLGFPGAVSPVRIPGLPLLGRVVADSYRSTIRWALLGAYLRYLPSCLAAHLPNRPPACREPLVRFSTGSQSGQYPTATLVRASTFRQFRPLRNRWMPPDTPESLGT